MKTKKKITKIYVNFKNNKQYLKNIFKIDLK